MSTFSWCTDILTEHVFYRVSFQFITNISFIYCIQITNKRVSFLIRYYSLLRFGAVGNWYMLTIVKYWKIRSVQNINKHDMALTLNLILLSYSFIIVSVHICWIVLIIQTAWKIKIVKLLTLISFPLNTFEEIQIYYNQGIIYAKDVENVLLKT